MPTLLLALLAAFPAEHIASLPTGRMLGPGRWQLNIVHRFGIPVFAEGWTRDPLQALVAADDYNAVDHGISRGLTVGLGLSPSDRVVDLHAAAAPLPWLRLYPMLSTSVRRIELDRTWLALGLGVPVPASPVLSAIVLPRLTTNATSHYLSLGLGAKYRLPGDHRVGLEAEPVLYRIEPGGSGTGLKADSLAWNLVYEREAGWHNFLVTIGSTRSSVPPYLFRDGLTSFANGGFRIGFSVVRKL